METDGHYSTESYKFSEIPITIPIAVGNCLLLDLFWKDVWNLVRFTLLDIKDTLELFSFNNVMLTWSHEDKPSQSRD